MQSQDTKADQNNDELEKKLELSEAWRLLLGMEAGIFPPPVTSDPTNTAVSAQEDTPLLTGDPWSSLIHASGIQVVDLQQVHIHTAQPPMNERDVEHALDIIQEER